MQDSMGLCGLIHVFSAIDRARVLEIPARMLHKLLLNYFYVAFTAFEQVMRSVDMASLCIQADRARLKLQLLNDIKGR